MDEGQSSYEVRHFECVACGNCCRGGGFVRVTEEEAAAIAKFLGLTLQRFIRSYARRPRIALQAAAGDLWLRDKPDSDACIFLVKNKCRINPVKPSQCLGFPARWRDPGMAENCKGLTG